MYGVIYQLRKNKSSCCQIGLKTTFEGEDMIPILVKEAVEIKIGFENFTGYIQSDYELAYALGLLAKIMKMDFDIEHITLTKLYELVLGEISSYNPKTYQEENLCRLIRLYKIIGTQSKEIKQLIKMGNS